MTLAGCGSEQETFTYEEIENMVTSEIEVPETTIQETTTSVEPTENGTTDELIGVSDSEYSDSCNEWSEAEDGSAECIDEDSPYYAQHFFNGIMFASLAAMAGNAMYQSKKKSDIAGRQPVNNKSVVPPTNNASTSTNPSTPTNNQTTTSGGGSGVNLSKPSSTNSYSSGKSGFSSGGASRGGSSSS